MESRNAFPFAVEEAKGIKEQKALCQGGTALNDLLRVDVMFRALKGELNWD
jgi:hypothetical protein